MFMTKLKLHISSYIVTTMDCYEKDGYIERNEFIENSIKSHSRYITTGSGSNIASPAVEIEVKTSMFLALGLLWQTLTTKTSVSSIVNKALAFSLPYLLEQTQAQEDYRLEIELSKI